MTVPDLTDNEVRGLRVLVKEAVDDTGAKLVADDAAEAQLVENTSASATEPGEKPEPMTFNVTLKCPARAAAVLKGVSGEAQFFVPGRDPGSSTTIAKFASLTDKPLPSPTLKANGVEIVVLSETGVRVEKKAAGDAARAKAKKEELDAESVESAGMEAEKDCLASYDPRFAQLLKVKDPQRRVGSYAYVDPKGQEIPVQKLEMWGYTFLAHGGGEDAPGPDWGLRIHLKTPGSMVVRSFALKDVPLP